MQEICLIRMTYHVFPYYLLIDQVSFVLEKAKELPQVPATFDSTVLPSFEGNVLLENLLIQNRQENHHRTSHTWPSAPLQFLQTKEAANTDPVQQLKCNLIIRCEVEIPRRPSKFSKENGISKGKKTPTCNGVTHETGIGIKIECHKQVLFPFKCNRTPVMSLTCQRKWWRILYTPFCALNKEQVLANLTEKKT